MAYRHEKFLLVGDTVLFATCAIGLWKMFHPKEPLVSPEATDQAAYVRMAAWFPWSQHKRKAQKRATHKQARAVARRDIQSV